ncbi:MULTISPECIES: UdgX family uracil-DNA binding protein [unclassified Sphingopyxis]|uniref:UdgX family uracil-DNA binding protein n=1 Tax=unclassified Sphingopyxis TaxID=2614943 RepID=UPI000730B019|nr:MULTISPECIES: UdgX family uracil-DNA binding protein [unclassified Sphingopyxis]KTE23023.1 DNA polymerase [Sphingopyxis sp. H057]KTE49696.1 DNA polymerase [Sphingopyxis sp. H073]KTE54160.1 DNA polymerase [Sphingopyxis sp. H071]KTE57211.1 DNA polymerase [Sphingopyxis sp. H107]KTE60688.1 DNA polymerase [Sphingopyxis sp. H100]
MREVVLKEPGDFAEWRSAARGLLASGIAPDDVSWRGSAEGASLFGDEAVVAPAGAVSLPRELLEIAERVICHRDPETAARLYRIIWRAARDRQLLARTTDSEIDWLRKADKAIRRDVHKMHAFVRFRRLGEEAGRESFAAWFEPTHRILRLTAPFFQRRFYGMDWAIVTPDARAIWQDETLNYGPGGTKDEVPDSDLVEDQWRTYYGAIFNPARVKIDAMRAEMPKKYWKNLPEAQDIAPLLAGAEARVERMREAAVSMANPLTDKWRTRVPEDLLLDDDVKTLADVARAVDRCTRCPLYCNATQGVAGEGPERARIMLVGEQPGDQEDLQGRPFVGPAGQVLNEALEEAGLDRTRLFLTNAVKHFKFEPRGKRRLHQNPTTGEIDICRWWLDKERALVQPDLIVTLGASALRGVTGKSASITSMRGAVHELEGGTKLIATIHPSFLLRLPDRERAAKERALFVADLALARKLAA